MRAHKIARGRAPTCSAAPLRGRSTRSATHTHTTPRTQAHRHTGTQAHRHTGTQAHTQARTQTRAHLQRGAPEGQVYVVGHQDEAHPGVPGGRGVGGR
jgi:hypothetical protein